MFGTIYKESWRIKSGLCKTETFNVIASQKFWLKDDSPDNLEKWEDLQETTNKLRIRITYEHFKTEK